MSADAFTELLGSTRGAEHPAAVPGAHEHGYDPERLGPRERELATWTLTDPRHATGVIALSALSATSLHMVGVLIVNGVGVHVDVTAAARRRPTDVSFGYRRLTRADGTRPVSEAGARKVMGTLRDAAVAWLDEHGDELAAAQLCELRRSFERQLARRQELLEDVADCDAQLLALAAAADAHRRG